MVALRQKRENIENRLTFPRPQGDEGCTLAEGIYGLTAL